MPTDIVVVVSALANAGGWAVVIAIGFFLGVAFVRRWLVPGWMFEREAKARDDAAATIAAFSKSLDALTDEVRWRGRGRDPR
jgi:hypothetical protein